MNRISPVKRDKMRKQQKLRQRQEMRESLPILTKEEIRRYRLQYHEALILDLEEQGYPSSAEYMRQLVDYQEALRQEHGPDTKVWCQPQLIKCKDELERVFAALRNAEAAHYEERYGTECDELIKLAIHYALGPEDWWWLGEQLLIQCIAVSSTFAGDGGRREALSKYVYAKFILENLKDNQRAKPVLKVCREISMGRSWTAKNELGENQLTIFAEACILLYKALLTEATNMMKKSPQHAGRICSIARKRALDACDHLGEAEALMLHGTCHMYAADYHAAANMFAKALRIYLKASQTTGICEARIQLAISYLQTDRFSDAFDQLEALHTLAEQNTLPFYVGRAHRLFGEFYLSQGKAHLATPYLIKALNIFHEIGELLNREHARNLAAISAGQELLPKYAELILKCEPGMKGWPYVLKMVMWKDTRELFWSTSDPGLSHSICSIRDSYVKHESPTQSIQESTSVKTPTEEDETEINVQVPE